MTPGVGPKLPASRPAGEGGAGRGAEPGQVRRGAGLRARPERLAPPPRCHPCPERPAPRRFLESRRPLARAGPTFTLAAAAGSGERRRRRRAPRRCGRRSGSRPGAQEAVRRGLWPDPERRRVGALPRSAGLALRAATSRLLPWAPPGRGRGRPSCAGAPCWPPRAPGHRCAPGVCPCWAYERLSQNSAGWKEGKDRKLGGGVGKKSMETLAG